VTVRLEHGDCLDVMRRLIDEGVQLDAIVTDPPYHLTSIVKRFGKDGAAPCKPQDGAAGAFARSSRGFMGKEWDGGDIAFRAETWALALQLLKPGGHMVAFSGTRTYHRMAVAIEDAGFEIRDQLAWCYGSGFPKSHDISKAIDREAGAVREVIGSYGQGFRSAGSGLEGWQRESHAVDKGITAPATEAARAWQGWGSALKPAWEPIALARKPLDGTLAGNTLKHGCGGLNIDGCRVGTESTLGKASLSALGQKSGWNAHKNREVIAGFECGRFPANLIHDGSPEVLAGFPETASGGYPAEGGERTHGATYGKPNARGEQVFTTSQGSAARFFYTAKADASDRLGSKHPTVKPVDLMAWLCRLITPPGGLILDPFAGSGTTGMAAMREGFHAILIEREAEYIADIKRRLAHVKGEDAPLFSAEPSPPPAKAVPSTAGSRTKNRADRAQEVSADV
jgi:DNA modification methylase